MSEIVERPDEERSFWVRDAIAAIICGAIPVLGVWVWGWNPLGLLLLFSFENAVIGVRQLVMMGLVGRAQQGKALNAIGQGVFFAIHYGGFTAAHGFFSVLLVMLMGPNGPAPDADGSYAVDPPQAWSNALAILSGYVPGIVSIIGWQAFQLVEFVRSGEAKTVSLNRLMGEPYARVVVLHLVIIIGAGLVLDHVFSARLFIVLALYKVAVDIGEVLWRAYRRPRPNIWEAMTPPPLGIAFDVARAPLPGWQFFLVIGVFILFGLFALFTPEGFWFGLLWLGFIGVFVFVGAYTIMSYRRQLIASLTNGAGRIVEGPVESFLPRARDAKRGDPPESFMVGGEHFAYAHNVITGGFSKEALRGGPIRSGLPVRIHYLAMHPSVGNVIARLEILGPPPGVSARV